jgi:hypothetical protein
MYVPPSALQPSARFFNNSFNLLLNLIDCTSYGSLFRSVYILLFAVGMATGVLFHCLLFTPLWHRSLLVRCPSMLLPNKSALFLFFALFFNRPFLPACALGEGGV